MLDAGTLVCIQSSSRKRVNSDWAMPSRVLVYRKASMDHSLQESGLQVEGRRTGVSESISPYVVLDWAWSAHSSGRNPDPCGRCQAFVPLSPTRCGWWVVDLQPHRCRRHALLGHWRILVMKKNALLGPGDQALTDGRE